MSVKVAVVVGVVAVALFAGSLVLGAGQDRGSSTDENALVVRLEAAAGDPSAVRRDDVRADCVDEEDPNLLLITGGCTVVVRNDGDLRLLGIVALDAVTVEAPSPEGDLDVEKVVAAQNEVRVAVGDGETEIRVTCRGILGECGARLVAE